MYIYVVFVKIIQFKIFFVGTRNAFLIFYWLIYSGYYWTLYVVII